MANGEEVVQVRRKQQLLKWQEGIHSSWPLTIDSIEAVRQLAGEKRKLDTQLQKEMDKRRKLESNLKKYKCESVQLRKITKRQAKTIVNFIPTKGGVILQRVGMNTVDSTSV